MAQARSLTPKSGSLIPRSCARGVGLILNDRAHRNQIAPRELSQPSLFTIAARPTSREELDRTLASFAATGIDTLVIDGGDGTIRDVLTSAAKHYTRRSPQVAVVPSGKTNALATDLGIPPGWTLNHALAAISGGRTACRAPLEVTRGGRRRPFLRGFLFGAGAFVRGTALAQRAHRLGAFGNLAVGLSVAAAIAQTVFGTRSNVWRRGEAMSVRLDDAVGCDTPLYLAMASTLRNLPLGMKPFGTPRSGLKFVSLAAPPEWILARLPLLLAGRGDECLNGGGVLRRDPTRFEIAPSRFVLDGETFEGGPLMIRASEPIQFVVP